MKSAARLVLLAAAGVTMIAARVQALQFFIETVDSEGVVGKSTSIAVDGDGNPHIAYFDITGIRTAARR